MLSTVGATVAQILPIEEREQRDIPKARWDALRLDYIAGNGTLEELATKHGFPSLATVSAKSASERWMELREERRERLKRELVNGPSVAPVAPGVLSPAWASEQAGKALVDASVIIGDITRLCIEVGAAGGCGMEQARAMGVLGSGLDRIMRFYGFGASDKKQSRRAARQARIVDPPTEAIESAPTPPIVPPAG